MNACMSMFLLFKPFKVVDSSFVNCNIDAVGVKDVFIVVVSGMVASVVRDEDILDCAEFSDVVCRLFEEVPSDVDSTAEVNSSTFSVVSTGEAVVIFSEGPTVVSRLLVVKIMWRVEREGTAEVSSEVISLSSVVMSNMGVV